MHGFLQKYYKALIKGGIIAIGLAIMLSGAGLFIISPAYVSTPVYISINILSVVFCWLVLTFLIQKFPIYKILVVLGLLVAVVVVERYMYIPFNPVTFPLLILFWLGVAYLILPEFFKKYKIAILSVYGANLSYFFIYRVSPDYIENHHQNFLNFLLIPIPVLAALWVYEQWRWLRTLKSDKAKAELMVLKNQIDPHFFFNTLNNLYGLTVEKSELAPTMILKLSDIMRYTIYDGKAEYVPLENEVAYLEDYIELHKIRYQKKVEITLQKDIQHAQKIAPLLLVVPLENAFKHGVESIAKHAFIALEISTTSTSLFFQISNNFESKIKKPEGIGLMNLKKRLALIYPNQHQIEITKTTDTYTLSLEIRSYELSNHR
ncbi:MAG: hypothetical protein CMO01_05515 [Thalassobius sp.]|nr:hypothetical protein [Thalassovita sp.]